MIKLLVIILLSGSLYAMERVSARKFDKTESALPKEMENLPKVFTQIEDELPKSWDDFHSKCAGYRYKPQITSLDKQTICQYLTKHKKMSHDEEILYRHFAKKRKTTTRGITVKPLLQTVIPDIQPK